MEPPNSCVVSVLAASMLFARAEGLAGTLQIENSKSSCLRNISVVPSLLSSFEGISISRIRNPAYLLDMVKGGFAKGGRYFSIYSSDSDVIRVTGYLVKRSEMDKLSAGHSVLQDTTALGLGAAVNGRVLERKRR
ncbi:MAG: DUF3029 family protein [Treponema sp.]|jgi:hypothetical protein|nr:DUF3029 family protein [Treponema sp.]